MEECQVKEGKKTKKGIVFVADNWDRYDHGGVDVFNQKLCEAMGYVMKREEAVVVSLIVSRRAIEDEMINSARDRNVILIPYVPGNNERNENICKNAVRKIEWNVPDTEFVWIGHDTISGEYACNMAKERNEKSAVILHTNYFRIHADRADIEERISSGNDNTSRDDTQQNLVKMADYVFCVGPKVFKKFEHENRNKQPKVFMIIPGLDGQRNEKLGRRLNIMISGRFYGGAAAQKNWKNTCKATIYALNMMADYDIDVSEFVITVCGFDPEISDTKLEELRNKAVEELFKETKLRPVIQFKPFDQSREKYLWELKDSALLIMGSEQESFGMVAWEALARGVPIVISKASGLYQYLDSELGYLLNGLCGSFPANRNNTMECMSESIAGILKDILKMKKATMLLQDMMSVHKWENLAITVAKKVGINAVMDEMTYKDQNFFEFTYAERRLMVAQIKRSVINQEINKRLVFFGGISRNIFWVDDKLDQIDVTFCDRLIKSLKDKEDLQVYVCYETGNAVNQRVEQMACEYMQGEETAEVLRQKAEKISQLRDYFKQKYHDDFNCCAKQFHLVPLTKSPSVYINIADEDWYFTVKYENRSTQSTTMKLKNGEEGVNEKRRLKKHMKFILSDNAEEECIIMMDKIEEWGQEYEYE